MTVSESGSGRGSGRPVILVVIGDVGRSPRMLSHARALVKLGHGVRLVGYGESQLPLDLSGSPRFAFVPLGDPLGSRARSARGLSYLMVSLLRMLWTLTSLTKVLVRSGRPAAILVQSPPVLPTLLAALPAAAWHRCRFVIDWHNIGSSVLALRLGRDALLVGVMDLVEGVLGRSADAHLTVSPAMASHLKDRWNLAAVRVLPDLPSASPPLRDADRADALWQKTMGSAFEVPAGRRADRLVSATSWTSDEDLNLLLDALTQFDLDPSSPDLDVIVTGRGSGRAAFESRVRGVEWKRVRIVTAWVSAEDYPILLTGADLGVCLHTSSSGLDFPMKVVDFWAAGLPVLAFDYGPALTGRLRRGLDGDTFASAGEFTARLRSMLTPDESLVRPVDRMKRVVAERSEGFWEPSFEKEALGALDLLAKPTGPIAPEDRAGTYGVTFLHMELGLGGAERLVVDSCLALKALGHQVRIMTTRHDPAHSHEASRTGGIPIEVVGRWIPHTLFGQATALCSLARSTWLALVASFGSSSCDVFVCDVMAHPVPLLRRLSGKPVAFYCHFPDRLIAGPASGLYALYRSALDCLEEFGMARCDALMVNSAFTAKSLAACYPRLPAADIVRPGLDPGRLGSAACVRRVDPLEADPESRTSPSRILGIHRFDRAKNMDVAVEAVGLLRTKLTSQEFDRVHLLLAGGYDRGDAGNRDCVDRLRRLIRDRDLESHVDLVFNPTDGELNEFLGLSTLLVYTPTAEHFGIVPLEAMACGLPVVACRSGGPMETVVDGATGRLVDPDPESFASALAELLGDPVLRASMATAGRRRVLQDFTRESFGQALDSILGPLARPRGSPH